MKSQISLEQIQKYRKIYNSNKIRKNRIAKKIPN